MIETLFIVNPASARGRTLASWDRVRKDLRSRGIAFASELTGKAGDASLITRRAIESGILTIIAVGGDGTLGEVVDGYLAVDGKPLNANAAIGLLPSGTGSDFNRSLTTAMSREPIKPEQRDPSRWSITGATHLIDAVRIEFTSTSGARSSRHFINLASFGLGGDTSELVNRWRASLPKWIGGGARFKLAALGALWRYRNVETILQADSCRELRINTNLIIVANGRFAGGGMMLAPEARARLDDGLLDVVITDGASRLDVIRELPRISRGAYLENRKVSLFRCRDISIEPIDALRIDVDGEMIGYTPAGLKALPSAVRFLIPA